jgi:hypothetical protein
MSDILAAADETAATKLVHIAESLLTLPPQTGNGSLGPFNAAWGASAAFSGGTVDLRSPDIIRIADCNLNYNLSFTFSFDLSDIIPDFCLPQICVTIPFIGRVCTPRICINWPTITIPVNYADTVKFTSDFRLHPQLIGSFWHINIEIVGIPFLQISAAAAAIIAAIGVAAAAILAPIPFIGPFLAVAVLAVTAAIGIAGVTGLLGPILSLFVSGLSFTIYKQPKLFEVLPFVSVIDPQVAINIDNLTASVQSTDEDELVIEAEISA